MIVFASVVILGTIRSLAQGTVFVYDQQSSTEANLFAEGNVTIQVNQPFGQSFTPSLNAVGFIRLDLFSYSGNGGASMDVVLHANSISGTVIGTSQTVFLPDNGGGFVNFYFDAPVSVAPGTTYYFQPVVQSGGNYVAANQGPNYNYAGGGEISQGVLSSQYDLWFREGIIVPEPSTWALLLIGAGAFVWFRRR